MDSLRVAVVLLCVYGLASANNFVSNALGSDMVLQREPYRARLWGWTQNSGATVTVNLGSKQYKATSDSTSLWQVNIDPMQAGGPYTIYIKSSEGDAATLTNVLFGDVYICSGQSNMQMTVIQAFNGTQEVNEANYYPDIRVMTVGQGTISQTPLLEFETIEQNWTYASNNSIGGPSWSHFSATCWFFAKNLYNDLQIPLGLVSSNWGGTIIQAWSSPQALQACNSSFVPEKVEAVNPNQPSVLWNAMIVPLLNMRVTGALWYQGEANVGEAQFYSCAFPAMISDWRDNFDENAEEFSFYFVQLAPYIGGGSALPDLRLAQMSALNLDFVGYACTVDLGDDGSDPFGMIHPRNKEEVGRRLSLSVRDITYSENIQYEGPAYKDFHVEQSSPNIQIRIEFEPQSIGDGLVLVNNDCPAVIGAQHCGWAEIGTSDGNWANATISLRGNFAIFSATVSGNVQPTGVRYLYGEWPVPTLFNTEGLPAIPFFDSNSFKAPKKVVIVN